MNRFFLSLGSNIFPQADFLRKALFAIAEFSKIQQVSPLFENPPLLPPHAPADWFQFFHNTVVETHSLLTPEEFLQKTKAVETQLGRPAQHEKWSPRVIDIDLIDVKSENGRWQTNTPQLTLPHKEFSKRNFVLSPLAYINKNFLSDHRRNKQPLSLFMTIFNVTPDSFSEIPSSIDEKLTSFKQLLQQHPAIVDLGAESTRHGAQYVSPEEEWQRLLPFLEHWQDNSLHYPFTKISIDTRHPLTARRALDYGACILNDVSGLSDPAMADVAQGFEKVIFMHSLTVPADPKVVLPSPMSPIDILLAWADQKRESLSPLANKLIFDPGLGFGKTPVQSLQIVQNIEKLHSLDLPLLIGHSRKSFLNLWSQAPFAERDAETLGLSAQLFGTVEYLRVHNLEAHQRLLRSLLAARNSV